MSTNILVIGLGGIGSFFASRLACVSGVKISAVCRSNYEAVRSNGFRVLSSQFGDHTVSPVHTFQNVAAARAITEERRLSWDYVLVSTKVTGTSDPSMALGGLLGKKLGIVLMQNGLSIEEPWRRRFPTATILSSVTRASMKTVDARTFKHCHWTRTSTGPYGDGTRDADKAAYQQNAAFAELLRKGGISDVEELDHLGMQFARWHKTAINAAVNPTSVLAGGPTNQAMSLDPEIYKHQKGVMVEVLDIAARVLGKPVPDELPTWRWVLDNIKEDVSGSYASMWHDWVAGREIELEAIVGTALRHARAVDYDAPRLQTMYALLKMSQQSLPKAKT